MELEGARLLLENQVEWRDVPEVVRSSFLLMAKEVHRLHLLVTNLLDGPDLSQSLQHDPINIQDLQAQMSQLKSQLQDQQDQAENRHLRTNQKLSSLWGQVAATAQAAADAQAATTDRIEASWTAAETQLKSLKIRMEQQDRRLKRDRASRTQSLQVDQALHELQKSQELCSQEIRRLKRVFEVEVRVPEYSGQMQDKLKGRLKKKNNGAVHVLLHQNYVEALKRQQQLERNTLMTLKEDIVTA